MEREEAGGQILEGEAGKGGQDGTGWLSREGVDGVKARGVTSQKASGSGKENMLNGLP